MEWINYQCKIFIILSRKKNISLKLRNTKAFAKNTFIQIDAIKNSDNLFIIRYYIQFAK